MKVSSLPPSSCRKARHRLRLGKLRFERFPHADAPLVPSPFVISQHRVPSECISANPGNQSDLDTPDLKTDDLKVDDLKVDDDHILVVDA